MHGLTKIFVVLAAVLSVALSTLVIAYAVNTDRVLANYTALQAVRDVQDAKISELTATQGAAELMDSGKMSQLQTELDARASQVQLLEETNASLKVEKTKAEAEREAIASKIAELGETVRTQATLIQSYTDEVRTLRQSEFTSRKAALDMEDRMSDLESQREVLEQNYRALQEELAGIRRSSDVTRTGGSGGGLLALDQPYTYAGRTIYGTVEQVEQDAATGGQLVKINIGSNDSVARNMRFGVVRNGQFLGNIVVISTDLKTSVGKFDALGTANSVTAGDRVQSKFQ